MDQDMIATHLENLDRRLARVEQILPTLASKEELKTLATKEELRAAVAVLATKEELRAAIAPLATKAELREEHDRLRLDMRILIEHQDSKLQVIAEHVLSLMPQTGSKDAS
jgi:uncharacterized protein YicC (UPF0701 family)